MVKDMNSRMDKYDYEPIENMSRSVRNKKIYNSIDFDDLSKIKTNNNVSIISDADKAIDIEKIKRYINANSVDSEKEEKRKRLSLELPKEEKEEVVRKEQRDYDVNTVLERARDKREIDYETERHRKLNSTQYDILKNLKIEENDLEESNISDEKDAKLNTEEKTIVDLIQTISINSKNNKNESDDLLQDLIGDNENTMVLPSIENNANKEVLKETLLDITQDLEKIIQPVTDLTEELVIEKEKLKDITSIDRKNSDVETMDNIDTNEEQTTEIEKSFFTNSMSFSKKDFEGFEDLEKDVKKSNVFVKIIIALIIIMLLGTIFIILNYVLDLKII